LLRTKVIKKKAIAKVVFSDVPLNHWARNSVYFCLRKGLLKGYPDSTFRGNRFVNRYEAAVIFARLFSNFSSLHFYSEDVTFLSRLISVCEEYEKEKRTYRLGHWDCSLFVQKVFSRLGIKLPRTTIYQAKMGPKFSYSHLKPGDLVFFDFVRHRLVRPSHVGIYIGNYRGIKHAFFHNTTKAKRVVLADLSQHWARSKFLYGVRVKK
jgi:hypothetical protein